MSCEFTVSEFQSFEKNKPKISQMTQIRFDSDVKSSAESTESVIVAFH